MKKRRKFFSYIADVAYAMLRFPSAWFKLWVVRGYFVKNENGKCQKFLFKKLLENGFKRTPWQVVFPGQTAGIIKTLPNNEQYHIRFYKDGTIDCELEVHRFAGWHWVGPRDYGQHLLEEIVSELDLPQDIGMKLSNLYGTKPYPYECMRPQPETEEIE